MDVEVSRPLDPIHGLEGRGGLHALIRWHGIPLGRIAQPPQNGNGAAADVTTAILLRHQLRAALQAPQPRDDLRLEDLLQTAPPASGGPFPLVTVAVCTRDRVTDLARCLDAVMDLDYPALDLLVVDNAPSTDATARLVATRYPRVRYVREPRPGLNWARNRAVHEARGEILAFTDDAAVVDRGWVTALARVFSADPEVMAVTGLVVPYELETEAQHMFERYGDFTRGYERAWHSVSRPLTSWPPRSRLSLRAWPLRARVSVPRRPPLTSVTRSRSPRESLRLCSVPAQIKRTQKNDRMREGDSQHPDHEDRGSN